MHLLKKVTGLNPYHLAQALLSRSKWLDDFLVAQLENRSHEHEIRQSRNVLRVSLLSMSRLREDDVKRSLEESLGA